MVQFSHPYMTTGKTMALTIPILVSKVMSLLFNRLSMFVIAFLPRSNSLLISWQQSPSAMVLEPKKIKSVTTSTFAPSICHEVMGPDAMILVFWMLSFRPAFSLPLSPSLRDSLVPLHFLPLEWYHLHIWSCWYFSQQSWFQLVLHPAQHFAWCTLHVSYISRVTIYSLDIQWTHVQSRLCHTEPHGSAALERVWETLQTVWWPVLFFGKWKAGLEMVRLCTIRNFIGIRSKLSKNACLNAWKNEWILLLKTLVVEMIQDPSRCIVTWEAYFFLISGIIIRVEFGGPG